jgi:hypothetical protein
MPAVGSQLYTLPGLRRPFCPASPKQDILAGCSVVPVVSATTAEIQAEGG